MRVINYIRDMLTVFFNLSECTELEQQTFWTTNTCIKHRKKNQREIGNFSISLFYVLLWYQTRVYKRLILDTSRDLFHSYTCFNLDHSIKK